MADGTLDPNGIWLYGEDDERDTFSELLNIGQETVSDAIGSDRARLAVLEAASATTAVATGIATASAGWSLVTARGRKKSGVAYVEFTMQRTGAAIVPGSNGDIPNEAIATLNAGWASAPGMRYSLSGVQIGCFGEIQASVITLTALVPNAALNTGSQYSFAGSYPLA